MEGITPPGAFEAHHVKVFPSREYWPKTDPIETYPKVRDFRLSKEQTNSIWKISSEHPDYPIQKVQNVEELKEKGQKINSYFQNDIQRFGDQIGADVKSGFAKDDSSLERKLNDHRVDRRHRGQEIQHLFDFVRASLVVKNIGSIFGVLPKLANEFEIVRINDRLTGKVTTGDYGDILLNIKFQDFITELLLKTRPIQEIHDGMNNHRLYEQERIVQGIINGLENRGHETIEINDVKNEIEASINALVDENTAHREVAVIKQDKNRLDILSKEQSYLDSLPYSELKDLIGEYEQRGVTSLGVDRLILIRDQIIYLKRLLFAPAWDASI